MNTFDIFYLLPKFLNISEILFVYLYYKQLLKPKPLLFTSDLREKKKRRE